MDRQPNDNRLYTYPLLPPAPSPSTLAPDAFTQQYGHLRPDLCPPPPPQPSTRTYQTQRTHPNQTYQSFNSSSFPLPNPGPLDLSPRQQATYSPQVFQSQVIPRMYLTASHRNNESFPFLQPPSLYHSSSFPPHSTTFPQRHPNHPSLEHLAGASRFQEINSEDEEEETNPTLHQTPLAHQPPVRTTSFLPDSRTRNEPARAKPGKPSEAELTDLELANLRRVTRYARENPIFPDEDDLEEADRRRYAEAKHALYRNSNKGNGRIWDCHNTISSSHEDWLKRHRAERHGRR